MVPGVVLVSVGKAAVARMNPPRFCPGFIGRSLSSGTSHGTGIACAVLYARVRGKVFLLLLAITVYCSLPDFQNIRQCSGFGR